MSEKLLLLLILLAFFFGCAQVDKDKQSVVGYVGEPEISPSGNWTRAVFGSAPAAPIPEEARVLYNKGNDQFARGDLGAAAKSFTQAIDIFPNFAEAYDNRGITYRRLGGFDKAIADHTKAIELNPRLLPFPVIEFRDFS